MTRSELTNMTVLQLRKLARESGVVLGAGIDKAAIIQKIAASLNIEPEAPVQQSMLDMPELFGSGVPSVSAADSEEELPSAPQSAESAAPESIQRGTASEGSITEEAAATQETGSAQGTAPVLREEAQQTAYAARETAPETGDAATQETGAARETAPVLREEVQPRFQAAWHSADSPQNQPPHPTFASTGPARSSRTGAAGVARPLQQEQRPLRSHSFGPRFGPAHSPASDAGQTPVAGPMLSPLPERRVGFAGSGAFGFKTAPVLSGEPAAAVSPVVSPTAPPIASPAESPAVSPVVSPVPEQIAPQPEIPSVSPTLEELLSTGEFEEGGGILELHPDGYGFLRSSNLLPSSRDIYVSMAQIRRFSLRTGDLIQGKIRPQREGDKYAALLYIDTVNGIPESETVSRPFFDELTPEYPSRRISLEAFQGPSLPDMRLIDLIAPLGFGQRGLLLCPPETGKRELLRNYANTIVSNYPDVTVMVLLIDANPEDVTAFRESVSCTVMASTFDQAPEVHLRLTEMVGERAMRLVEQKKDVVILVDSLTRLAKVYTSTAAQQGRSLPGMVNPSSLLRTKRLFGAARCMKEGGSLTVIAAMDIGTGNRVDDSIVEEFKGTANMELTLDRGLVQAGISPAILLQRSFTKNADLLLNARQKEGLELIRQMLGSTSSAVAIPQILSMMEKTATNAELLSKMKDWFALMNM